MDNKSRLDNINIWLILLKMLGLAFLGIVISSVIQAILSVEWTFLSRIIIYPLWLVLIIHTFRINGITKKEVIGEASLKDVPWIILISIKLLLIIFSWLSQSVGVPFIAMFYPDIYTEAFTSYLELETGSSLDLNMIMMPIISFTLVPVFEELIFRGFLFNKWSAKIGVGKALIFSSLLFAFLHLDIIVFPAYFAAGIFYGLVYLKTKKLLIPIILHSISNFVSGFTTFLPGSDITTVESLRQTTVVGAIFYIVLFPIVVIILYRLYKSITIKENLIS